VACGDDGEDWPEECDPERGTAGKAVPMGAKVGEPYRWLARSWTSPLGLTFRRYGIAIDGVPVHGRRQVEVYDQRGQLVHRAGSGDEVLAQLWRRGEGKAESESGARRYWHPLAGEGIRRRAQPHPMMRDEERPVWHYADGQLRAAVAAERMNLVGETPVGEVVLRDAVTGAQLAKHRTIFDVVDPEYLVYAREDGRPLYSPMGDIYPHPTGVPDNQKPAMVSQRAMKQSEAMHAREEAWLDDSENQTKGRNVIAFFNSMLDGRGTLADFYDEDGANTPEYGPMPDDGGYDFFAEASGDGFSTPYDASEAATSVEYFQDGLPGDVFEQPDPNDAAIHAKIVQAFYSTNWLHDFFYAAGFDEVAGNAQQRNGGRGGLACDPMIVHAGSLGTFTFPTSDGRSPVIELGLNARSRSRRDASMDFTIVAHEWGHYLVGRLAGGTFEDASMHNLQGRSMHEAIADFVAVLVNLDAGDDLNGAFPIGGYSNLDYIERRDMLPAEEAPADLYYGIRRYPYSLDLAKNPLTFRHLAEPPPTRFFNWKGRGPKPAEEHTAGEIFSQALFQCFGGIVAANAGTPFEALRARMAQYLVAGLAAFPDRPTFLEGRDAFLSVIRLVSPSDHLACRAGFAVRGMGSGARGPDREFGSLDFPDSYDVADVQESFVDAD
jgi:Fungalysin metallopeptidase (M36)